MHHLKVKVNRPPRFTTHNREGHGHYATLLTVWSRENPFVVGQTPPSVGLETCQKILGERKISVPHPTKQWPASQPAAGGRKKTSFCTHHRKRSHFSRVPRCRSEHGSRKLVTSFASPRGCLPQQTCQFNRQSKTS